MSEATFRIMHEYRVSDEIRRVLVQAGFDEALAQQSKELEEERERKEEENSKREENIDRILKEHPDLKQELRPGKKKRAARGKGRGGATGRVNRKGRGGGKGKGQKRTGRGKEKGRPSKIPASRWQIHARSSDDDWGAEEKEVKIIVEEEEEVKFSEEEVKEEKGNEEDEEDEEVEEEDDDDDDDDNLKTWEEAVCEVERILDSKTLKTGERKFKIKWKGYSNSNATWEPEGNLNEELVQDYLASKPQPPTKVPIVPTAKNAVQQQIYDGLRSTLETQLGRAINSSEASKLWEQAFSKSLQGKRRRA